MSFYEFQVLTSVEDQEKDTKIEKYLPQIINLNDVMRVCKNFVRDDLFNFVMDEGSSTKRTILSIKSDQETLDKVFGIKRGEQWIF